MDEYYYVNLTKEEFNSLYFKYTRNVKNKSWDLGKHTYYKNLQLCKSEVSRGATRIIKVKLDSYFGKEITYNKKTITDFEVIIVTDKTIKLSEFQAYEFKKIREKKIKEENGTGNNKHIRGWDGFRPQPYTNTKVLPVDMLKRNFCYLQRKRICPTK